MIYFLGVILVLFIGIYLYRRNKNFDEIYENIKPIYKYMDDYKIEIKKKMEAEVKREDFETDYLHSSEISNKTYKFLNTDTNFQLLEEFKNKNDYLTITDIQYFSYLVLNDKNFFEARRHLNLSVERGECRSKIKANFIFGIIVGFFVIPFLFQLLLELL